MLPKSKTVSRNTTELYEQIKTKIIKEVGQSPSLAITADHLTRTSKGRNFLGVNVTYVVGGHIKSRQLTILPVTNKKCPPTAHAVSAILQAFGN